MARNKLSALRNLKPEFILKLFAIILAAFFILAANFYSNKKNHDSVAELLVEDDYLPRFVSDVSSAKKSLYCAMYMFKVDSYSPTDGEDPTSLLASAMINAAKRGIDVAIVLDEGDKDDLTTKFNKKTAKILEKNGVRVIFYPPERRLHSKICLIDEEILFIGSHNYTYSAMERNSESSVRIFSKKIGHDTMKYLTDLGL